MVPGFHDILTLHPESLMSLSLHALLIIICDDVKKLASQSIALSFLLHRAVSSSGTFLIFVQRPPFWGYVLVACCQNNAFLGIFKTNVR